MQLNHTHSNNLKPSEEEYYWFVFTYYVLKEHILNYNLSNQGIECFIPKVSIIKNNRSRVMNLFPGYGFAYLRPSNVSQLKYTRGIKTILRQGNSFASISQDHVSDLMLDCENTKVTPIESKPLPGDLIQIARGALKGHLAHVVSLNGSGRIQIMLSLLSRESTLDFDLKHIKQI